MKNRVILSAFIIVLLSCCAHGEEFVDKRFNKPLYNQSSVNHSKLYLTPNRIHYYDQGEKFQFDCLLLENKMSYLKFKCTYVYSKNDPLRTKGYQQIMTFKIYKDELDKISPNCDRVKEYDYELDEKDFTYMGNFCIYKEDPQNEE